jgi:hypothetical protein
LFLPRDAPATSFETASAPNALERPEAAKRGSTYCDKMLAIFFGFKDLTMLEWTCCLAILPRSTQCLQYVPYGNRIAHSTHPAALPARPFGLFTSQHCRRSSACSNRYRSREPDFHSLLCRWADLFFIRILVIKLSNHEGTSDISIDSSLLDGSACTKCGACDLNRRQGGTNANWGYSANGNSARIRSFSL